MEVEINLFIDKLKNADYDIYNEFGIQFELAMFLRSLEKFKNYKIELERPIGHFKIKKSIEIPKKEIDLCIYNESKNEYFAIEIKFSKHGQVPLQMFEFCKDICLLEHLKKNNFKNCYSIVIVDRTDFFQAKNKSEGIYEYFRGEKFINGIIVCPTGKQKGKKILIDKFYKHKFEKLDEKHFYSLVKI